MATMPERTFFISGASKGIGLATAQHLASKGHTVLGAARSDCPENFPGHYFPCDLADPAATDALVERLKGEFRIDGVVNNVALVGPDAVADIKVADLQAVLDLNLRTAISFVQMALPNMLEQKWGRIVNISSITALGAPWRSSYSAAKAALIGLARTWALEFVREGITANAIGPGPVETELFRRANPVGSESAERYISGIPMKRIGLASEIAAAIGYFLSEEAAFTTGQTLYVDGGSSVGQVPV